MTLFTDKGPALSGKKTATFRADDVAAGEAFRKAYESKLNVVLAEDMPWEKSESLITLMSHMNSPGKDPREFVPDMDPALVKVLRKAIERDPRERYQTAGEMRDAFKSLAREIAS